MSPAPHVRCGRSVGVLVLALLVVGACTTYTPAPLDPAELIAQVDARRAPPDGAVLDLALTVELARERSPALLDANAAASTARALADTPIPLPNPSFSVGPLLLSSSDIPADKRWGFESAMGWVIDLNGSRSVTTNLREREARVAEVEAAATERTTYLAIRRAFVKLSFAQLRAEALTDLRETADDSLAVTRRLVEAAQATALDVRELEVERFRALADVLACREEADEGRGELEVLTGLLATTFGTVEAASAPERVPTAQELRTLLLRDHPGLAQLRAEYDVAETTLELAVAESMPDLEVGPSYEREEDADKWVLSLGFDVPIFDRNQPEIARATAHRAAVRTRYEAEAARALAAIDAALRRIAHRAERLALLTDSAAPAAESALGLARRGLASGAADALRFLSVARSEREVRVARLDAEEALLTAWADLEAACGAPILSFPSTSRPPTEGADDTGDAR